MSLCRKEQVCLGLVLAVVSSIYWESWHVFSVDKGDDYTIFKSYIS